MSTTTAFDIIKGALRALQVASDDVVLTASEANDALDALNLMIDSWSTESLMLMHIVKETFTLTANKNPHTIGTGGDFNTDRPTALEMATYGLNGVDYPLRILQYDDYSQIKLKGLATTISEFLYYDANYPLGNVYLYPIPSAANSLTLYSRKALTGFANLTSTFSLPKGYPRALKFNLAVEIAPEYQTTAGADVIRLANESKANVKRINRRPITMQVDPAILSARSRKFNIYRGQ